VNLEFRNIGHHYGATEALSHIELTVPSGEITCLLGASGCGKTTLLNLAAGLLGVQQGEILLDGKVMADTSHSPPPEERDIGLVFQNGALFPHMNLADNILFGVAKSDRSRAMADEWLERIGLAGLAERFPATLSGGQQQRVALARAMAPQPAVLLLDEPFASIDVVLRRDLRRECRRLLKAREATALMVTHDPEEAMDIADTVAVMEAGRIVQADTPDALYNAPASASVGALFGDTEIVEAQRAVGGWSTPFGIWQDEALASALPDDVSRAQLLVREGAVRLEAASDGDTALTLTDIRAMGRTTRYLVTNAQGDHLAITQSGAPQALCGSVTLIPNPASIIAFAK
jgi:iron(III) transport system ATP-binding protein